MRFAANARHDQVRTRPDLRGRDTYFGGGPGTACPMVARTLGAREARTRAGLPRPRDCTLAAEATHRPKDGRRPGGRGRRKAADSERQEWVVFRPSPMS
jgi:hypothetical protein